MMAFREFKSLQPAPLLNLVLDLENTLAWGQQMTAATTPPVYHRLVVVADSETVIWLVDDCWHPVHKAIGTLDTRVLRGRYFIELGEAGPSGVAYPMELFQDLRLTQEVLEAGPACQRQPPVLLEDV